MRKNGKALAGSGNDDWQTAEYRAHHVRPAQRERDGLCGKPDCPDPQPGRAGRTGHPLHERLLSVPAVCPVPHGLYVWHLPQRSRRIRQQRDPLFRRPHIRPRPACGGLRDRPLRSDALCRAGTASWLPKAHPRRLRRPGALPGDPRIGAQSYDRADEIRR